MRKEFTYKGSDISQPNSVREIAPSAGVEPAYQTGDVCNIKNNYSFVGHREET